VGLKRPKRLKRQKKPRSQRNNTKIGQYGLFR
jgi:hypothetical protein